MNGPAGLNRRASGPPFAQLVILGAIVLGLLAVTTFLVARACGSDECSDYFCASSEAAPAPEGYRLVTRIFEHNQATPTPQGSDLQVLLPLTVDGVDGSGLTFYEFDPLERTWTPIAAATLAPEGGRVTGLLNFTPAYLAVLQRVSPAGQVVAYLTPGTSLHPDAVGRVTIVHTRDLQPAGDGSLTGSLSTLNPDPSYQFIPMVYADAATDGSVAAVTSVLSSATTRTQHVTALLQTAIQPGVAGIDIAYLDLPADQRTSFTLFVAELGQALRSSGKLLTLTLPHPARSGQSFEEGAYDWAELAKSADFLKLRPYLDQSTYRIVMPSLLDYLATRVDPAKIILTVSPLATEKGAGTDGLRTLTIVEAMQIATRLAIQESGGGQIHTESVYDVAAVNINKEAGRSGMAWSPETATVSFTYDNQGGRTVFIENAFSIGFKLEYIRRYRLGGVAVADASDNVYLGNIWTAVIPFAVSGQPQLLQPNSSDLQPVWRVSGGLQEGGVRGVLQWTTPAQPGSYSVYLTLSDGVALFENELVVTVVEREAAASAAPSN